MTEITENTANPRYIIDPVAFFGALVGGPILFTAATFWILYIPVFALAVGGIPYLLVGAPVLLIHLRYRPAQVGGIAWLAFLSFAAAWVAVTLVLLLANPDELGGTFAFSVIVLAFGTFFSTCWGASFGWLYTALARDFYTAATPC